MVVVINKMLLLKLSESSEWEAIPRFDNEGL